MDSSSTSSGHITEATTDHEQSKLALETRDRNEMTLMRLRRITRTVMCKNDRLRLQDRMLQRSNTIKFIGDHLMHTSEQIRSSSLQLLCCMIPRLGSKTDLLLKPLLPKIFQCLKKNETENLKTRALHFLRGYFHHTRKLSGFMDTFVKLGIHNSDTEIQFSCCIGLNIIFDQDLGNALYSQLVMPVASILIQKNNSELTRAAYRALKYIHTTVGDGRFFDLMNMTHPAATEVYKNLYDFEEKDSFLIMEDNDCSTLVSEYQLKRCYLNISKDFGILDPNLLHEIQITRNCERARAVSNFFIALKRTSWTAEDLDHHALDFLKVIRSFVSDANRLVQMYAFDILKEIINRMGFTLAPHIHQVLEILRQGLTSANTKIKMKVCRVLNKLMRGIHPMTVVWNLLNTSDTLIREAVIILIQNMLSHFPYHEIDMITLCKYLGHNLEDENIKLANCSKDCIILLLDIMRDCPVHGIKIKAVRALLKNRSLSAHTLKDIGIIGSTAEDDYQGSFESYSDEDITDQDISSILDNATVITPALSPRSLSTNGESDTQDTAYNDLYLVRSFKTPSKNASCSHFTKGNVEPSDISLTTSHESMSTAGETDSICDVTYHDLITSGETFYEPVPSSHMHKEYKSSKAESVIKENMAANLDANSSKSNQAAFIWGENYNDSVGKIGKNMSSSIEERLLSAESGTTESSFIQSHENRESYAFTQQWSNSMDMCNHQRCSHHQKNAEDCSLHQIIPPENADGVRNLNSSDNKRKYFTRFYMNPMTIDMASDSEKKAGGDAYVIIESNLSSAGKSENEPSSKVELTSNEQSGIQVDVMNNDVYNFNILTIDHEEADKYFSSTDDFDPIDNTDEIDETNVAYIPKEIPLDTYEVCPRHKPNTVQKSKVPKFIFPKLNLHFKISKRTEFMKDNSLSKSSVMSQELVESNISKKGKNDSEITTTSLDNKSMFRGIPTERNISNKESHDVIMSSLNKEITNTQVNNIVKELDDKTANDNEKSEFSYVDEFLEEDRTTTGSSGLCSNNYEETPFMPKNRQLPRTPVKTKPENSLSVQSKHLKNCGKNPISSKRGVNSKQKKREVKHSGFSRSNHCEEREKSVKEPPHEASTLNSTTQKSCGNAKYNSPPNWGGCQWRRDLEYASKALPCTWVDKFEETIKAMKPLSSTDAAENEMKKAIEDMHGNSWKKKDEALLTVIQLAKHHPEVVQENTSKIAFLLCNEVKNFRQSVAGKAVLTIGHLYEIMGKHFENKLRLVIPALLAKSGNRTLAAYFRLVIKTLFKIMNSSPQKAAIAFIYEGYKHTNKAARETAAQFLTILTENLGPLNSLTPTLSSHMLKCATTFAFDSSALTRYCGKRMLKVFKDHPDFERIKDQHLGIDAAHNLSKVLEQITSKGVGEDILPISLIN